MSTSTPTPSERAIEEKIPWIITIVVTLFIGIVGTIALLLMPSGYQRGYGLSAVQCGAMSITSAPFLLLMVTWLLMSVNKGLRRRISLTTLTYLYVVALAASWSEGWRSIGSSFVPVWMTWINHPEIATEVLPWFISPGGDVVKQLYNPGPIPWGAWIPSILFWGSYQALVGIFLIAIGTLFQRGWIDIEKVPFPHMIPAYEIIRRMPTGTEHRRLDIPFAIGMLLGLLWKLTDFSIRTFPWFPDILAIAPGAWPPVTCGWGGFTNHPEYVTGSIVGIMGMQKDPFVYAIAYLAPLSILFNVWFWYLVYLILTQIAMYFGYYTGIADTPGCCRYRVVWEAPFKWNALSTGAQVAWTFVYLFLARSYIIETFKAAIGKLSHERRREIEKDAPISYRATYIMLWGSFIAMTVLFMAMGLSLATALLMPITFFVFWLSNARMVGLSGTYYCTNEHGNTFYRLLVWPSAPANWTTKEFQMAAYFSEYGVSSFEQHMGGAIISAFQGYTLASLTGVSKRGVLKAMLIPTILCPFLATITFIGMSYTFGVRKIGFFCGCSMIDRTGNTANWVNWPGTEPFLTQFFSGALIVIVLGILHARFFWFPFDPLGFIIATGLAGIFFGFWTAALGAWIMKTITLKIGGSKLYENLGIPVACGFIAGYMIAVLFGTVIADIRFFIPF
jgi:hypothetical protein